LLSVFIPLMKGSQFTVLTSYF